MLVKDVVVVVEKVCFKPTPGHEGHTLLEKQLIQIREHS